MSARATAAPVRPYDPVSARRAVRARGLLAAFNAAGVLSAADVHVAARLTALAGEEDEQLQLAIALAVRAPRLGHVYADLASVANTATVEAEEPVELDALPWPDPGAWPATVARSSLVAGGEEGGAARPVRLLGTRLYLDRYWREERTLAADLRGLGEAAAPPIDRGLLAEGLARLFTGEADGLQALAAAAAVLRPLAVVAGGPGTGKTTTVARVVALLAEQAAAHGAPVPLIALAAPTGKAAVRLQEAVHSEAAELDVTAAVKRQLRELRGTTLHRLLGWRPGTHSRFAHNRADRLPHDVIVVDETSMVSLSLMARLLEAVRPDARLILVGDPGQLAAIEAGVVLGDVVGPAAERLQLSAAMRRELEPLVGGELPALEATPERARAEAPPPTPIGDGIVTLRRVHRFGEGVGRLADAIRRGHADSALAALGGEPEEITWLPVDLEDAAEPAELEVLNREAMAAARAVLVAAQAGESAQALLALARFRLLCAHRHGRYGASSWNSRIASELRLDLGGADRDLPAAVGRPLLITKNDPELGLVNGDAGVIVSTEPGRTAAVFTRGAEPLALSPLRLTAAETMYAMTIHKSQGSQYDTAAVILPPSGSRILTRELLYTAVTRARRRLIVLATEDAVRTAVERPVSRASGLRERLWP